MSRMNVINGFTFHKKSYSGNLVFTTHGLHQIKISFNPHRRTNLLFRKIERRRRVKKE